jgi:hypothetical protein
MEADVAQGEGICRPGSMARPTGNRRGYSARRFTTCCKVRFRAEGV